MARQGNAAASWVTTATATDTLVPGAGAAWCPPPAGLAFLPGRTRRASTGRQTGRGQNGKATTIPAGTKPGPKPNLPAAGGRPAGRPPPPGPPPPGPRNSAGTPA